MIVPAYAVLAALCRPLTLPALAAVLIVGVPLVWYGIHCPAPVSGPVGRRSVAVWGGVGTAVVALESALLLGPNDTTWPTLSTLLDPVFATYPGRVAGYLVWTVSGLWLLHCGRRR